MQHELILILDFGSQYTQLIARRVREQGVYCEIHPFHLSAEAIAAKRPKGVILSGGPSSVTDEDAPRVEANFYDTVNAPILGICYGMQMIAVEELHRNFSAILRIRRAIDRAHATAAEQLADRQTRNMDRRRGRPAYHLSQLDRLVPHDLIAQSSCVLRKACEIFR